MPSKKGFDPREAPCLVAVMPKRRSAEPTSSTEAIHKTTANLPVSLYEDLRLLATFEPGGSFNAILVRAARELVEREQKTLEQMRKIQAERSGGRAKR